MLSSRAHEHCLSRCFRVEIEGITAGGFAEDSGMEICIEVIEYADGGPHSVSCW